MSVHALRGGGVQGTGGHRTRIGGPSVQPGEPGEPSPPASENGPVRVVPTDLSVDEIVEALAAGAGRPLGPGQPASQLDHALQTAALLRHLHRGDGELAAAGLVHDIGHLLPGVTDETHAAAGATAVRRSLGQRVAAIVSLHVEAKRYLVATERAYGRVLSTDSVVSLRRQGGALSEEEAASFRARPWAADALVLRRADDSAKVEGLEVAGLAHWRPLLRQLSGAAGARSTH